MHIGKACYDRVTLEIYSVKLLLKLLIQKEKKMQKLE